MRPVRIIKTFADLRAAIAEVASEDAPTRPPPMSPEAVEAAARAFVHHRREPQRDGLRDRS